MKSYPWLQQHYRKIIEIYQSGKAHHALLIQTIKGMGDDVLIWDISCWLMCKKPAGLKICGICHGCRLMKSHSHPDWYRLSMDKKELSIGIDEVRKIMENLFLFAKQEGAKVIWIPDASQLTEAASNALLKTLEEPLENCWFFLSIREPLNLLATIRSRCMIWNLLPPDEDYGLQWLKRKCLYPNNVLRSALRLSNGAPVAAFDLLKSTRWQNREILNKTISGILHNDILKLLPVLNSNDIIENINWLISILVDAIKAQLGVANWVINSDYFHVINFFAQQLNINQLNLSVQTWLICRNKIQKIPGLNHELVLIDALLSWESLINSSTKIN